MVLYAMIAVAGWRLWRVAGAGPALVVWAVALVLNAAWSYLMFGRHRIDLALADIVALLVSIALIVALAWRADRAASALFLPYLAWVGFAAALNLTIYRLN
jgi:tryptophan-rich sensory protein